MSRLNRKFCGVHYVEAVKKSLRNDRNMKMKKSTPQNALYSTIMTSARVNAPPKSEHFSRGGVFYGLVMHLSIYSHKFRKIGLMIDRFIFDKTK